jgi:signal transduction histidine kinase
MKSPFLDANIITNLAVVYARQHRFAQAEKAADTAMKLLGPRDESGGMPFVWGIKAMVDYERGALKDATSDVDRAFRGLNLKTTISPFRDVHEVAYKVYRDAGNPALALAHLEAFKRLDDQGRSLATTANLALIGAQFDFANQRLEIEHLKAVQLERDISLKESRAALQRLILTALLLTGLVLIGWISWRHMLVSRHRRALGAANVRLTETLQERDVEIERRTETEAQLRIAMDAAAEAHRAKHHFLANMSHELRTPLNAIIGFSELMASGLTARAQEYAADINTSGRRLLSVLNDILDMARIDSGTLTLTEEDVPLAHIVREATAELEQQARAAGKTIDTDRVDTDIWLRCDEGKLRQAVVKLLSNALKFTGASGKVEVSTERGRDGVDLLVSDNGPGIPEDKVAHVLEPFGQAESAYARSHGGVGLGLPIVKSLVELHGGSIVISSTEGEGTTIRVHLPAERVVQMPPARIAAVA